MPERVASPFSGAGRDMAAANPVVDQRMREVAAHLFRGSCLGLEDQAKSFALLALIVQGPCDFEAVPHLPLPGQRGGVDLHAEVRSTSVVPEFGGYGYVMDGHVG